MGCARAAVVALLAVLPFSQVSAEITLDGTMGAAGPLAGPNFTIADTDGTTQGTNLFHSFSVFNINSTESATFTGPAGLDNVISRVTGGTASSIDGLFRSTVPSADVYFINPAGVVFGQNATLDVPGAFHTSSADELRFTDSNVFSASNPPATVLTAAAPAAFGFLGANPAGITFNDSALSVPTGQTLSLVGGDVTIAGTDRNRPSPQLEAASGRINLVSVGASGGVTIAGGELDAGGFAAYGEITVAESRLAVSGSPSGAVYIEGGNIVVDSSHIRADNSGPADGGGITFKGKDVLIRFDENRLRSDQTQPRIEIDNFDSGRGGDIDIQADSLTLENGVRVIAYTGGSGRGGDLNITVDRFEASSTGTAFTETDGTGRGGDVTLAASTVLVIGELGALPTGISADTGGDGAGGDVLVRADDVELVEAGFIDAFAFQGSTGKGGDVTVVATNSVEIRNGSAIQSAALGSGDSGDVEVTAGRILVFSDDGPGFTQLNTFSFFGTGNAGDLTLRASSLEVREGIVGSVAIGPGSGGDTRIFVDSLLVDGNGIVTPEFGDPQLVIDPVDFTQISSGGLIPSSGPAGNVEIVAKSVVVRGGASIDSGTAGMNPGGNIDITADQIRIETDARIDTTTNASGPAGTISLKATDLVLSDGGNITASSSGTGLAGDIAIDVANSIRISDGLVTTEALASDGGNITLNAVTLIDLLNSSITTSVGSGAGAGGNINIDPQFVIVQNSNIIANAFGGPGGNINIVAGLFLMDPSSVVSASSALGIDGIINVDSPVADVTSGVTELPADELDASTLVQAPCAARTGGGTSSLTSAGRSGLPADPDGYMPSPGLASGTSPVSTADAVNVPAQLHSGTHGDSALLLAMSGFGCS
jgi:filamentous hemagglutinin family protein